MSDRSESAAVIGYNVPLPTSHTGTRLLEISDIKKDAWKPGATTTVKQIIKDHGLAKETAGGGFNVNVDAAFAYWREHAMLAGMSSQDCDNARTAWEQATKKKD
jgi:hypothetical protein